MAKQSYDYERAKSMVLSDKFNLRQTDFFEELKNLVSRYAEFDALEVETSIGSRDSLVITVSVKKIKPTFRPLS